MSIAILAHNVIFIVQLVPELITYYIDLHLMIYFYFLSWCIYRVVTRARACAVRRSNVSESVSMVTRMFCSMHAGLLGGRCLGRRCRVSLEQLGTLCGGCVCQRWGKKIYIYITFVSCIY